MAKFDLRHIQCAKYVNTNGTITFTDKTAVGDAMQANISLRFAEGRLYAESHLAEFIRKCTGGTVSLGSLAGEHGIVVEYPCSPWFLVVLRWCLPECCGRRSGFLVDFEWAGDDGLRVFIQCITKNFFQGGGVNTAGNGFFPSDFVAPCHHGFFIAHKELDFIGDGVHLVLKFFCQFPQFHEFFNLRGDGGGGLAHFEILPFFLVKSWGLA